MTNRFFIRAVSFIIVLGIMISFVGCAGNAEYIKEAATKRGISYSFEYPTPYIPEMVDPSATDNLTVIGNKYVADNKDTGEFKQINISLWHPTTDYPNAKARADYYFGIFEAMGQKLLFANRAPGQLAVINGEALSFSYRMGDSEELSKTITGWMTFIDYKGQIVHLSVTGTATLADEAKADFEHVIDTFKFLN